MTLDRVKARLASAFSPPILCLQRVIARRRTLISTLAYTTSGTMVRLATGLVSTKVTAYYLGPAGLAIVAQLQNFLTLVSAISGAGISNGVVRYVAEFRDDEARRREILSTALWITAVSGLVSSFSVLVLREDISGWLFGTADFAGLFALVSCAAFLSSVVGLLSAILNGSWQIRQITTANVASHIAALLLVVALTLRLGTEGALLATVLAPMISATILFIGAMFGRWIRWIELFGKFRRPAALSLLRFAVMAIVSGVLPPLSYMLVRSFVVKNLSAEEAGYWQAITRISDIYLLLVTMPIAQYYLPRLSELRDLDQVRSEVKQAYVFLLPITVISATAIYAFRDWILLALFAPEFRPARDLFAFQLTGDCLKISSWILSYLMLARAMLVRFIMSEVAGNVCFVIFNFVLCSVFGIIGTSYAFAATYLIYLILMCWFFRDVLGWGAGGRTG